MNKPQFSSANVKLKLFVPMKNNLFLCMFQNRELQIMRKLEHQNIVKLKYFFYSSGEKVGKNVCIVFLCALSTTRCKSYCAAKAELILYCKATLSILFGRRGPTRVFLPSSEEIKNKISSLAHI